MVDPRNPKPDIKYYCRTCHARAGAPCRRLKGFGEIKSLHKERWPLGQSLSAARKVLKEAGFSKTVIDAIFKG